MLVVEGLRKSYGTRVALSGVDFEVGRGETVAIMGPSGCGKSTLVRCINRLTEPDAGRVFLGGREITAMDRGSLQEARQRIGFVFQHSNLIARLSVLDNVVLGLRLSGMERSEAEERGLQALARVGLADRAGDSPAGLSGGQQQRVGIARALAPEPEIMLWDEPTASLDPILVGEVIDVLEDLARANTTMLVVTHELDFALRAAQRVMLMEHGRVVEQGHPARVFAEPRSDVGRKYRGLLDRWRRPVGRVEKVVVPVSSPVVPPAAAPGRLTRPGEKAG